MPKLYEIKYYGADILTQCAQEVTELTPEISELIQDMIYTMYHSEGCGLAAPQIGISKQIFVCDLAKKEEDRSPKVFINPEFTMYDGEQINEEGCLSFPEVYERIKRFETVKVRYKDENFTDQELEATGLLAVVIQHESDHLKGILLTDKMQQIRKMANGFRLNKIKLKANTMSDEAVIVNDDV